MPNRVRNKFNGLVIVIVKQRIYQDLPADVITMRSEVSLKDLVSGESNTYSLVFPTEPDFAEERSLFRHQLVPRYLVSRKGDTIEWHVSSGLRKLKVEEVLSQPGRQVIIIYRELTENLVQSGS